MYKLAPFADSYDMWVALAFCYLPVFIFIIFAYMSSKSGSWVKESLGYRDGYRWVKSDVNVPILKQGLFKMAILWLVLGSFFFWDFLWPDHHDVWFIITDK